MKPRWFKLLLIEKNLLLRRCWFPRGRRYMVELELLYEPRDVWVGLYWVPYTSAVEFYVCFIPLLPVRLYVQKFR